MERRDGAVLGFVVGALVALFFAVVISLVPAFVFLETQWRVLVFVVVAVAAPPTVWFLQWVARSAARGRAPRLHVGGRGRDDLRRARDRLRPRSVRPDR